MSNGYYNHDVPPTADYLAGNPLEQLQQAVDQSSFSNSNYHSQQNFDANASNDSETYSNAQSENVVAAAAAQDTSNNKHCALPSTKSLDALISGVDTSNVNLSFPPVHRISANNPSPEGWRFPHKKGMSHGSNLDAFKNEILERTAKGENCKTIAQALIAKGVQTSDRAISRRRIVWGARRRAPRKLTEKSVENIRRAGALRANLPPGQEASFRQRARVQIFRKTEITRMTQEGMSAKEIAANLGGRGMVLKKGASTVLRLQTVWGLVHDDDRFVKNIRHKTRKEVKLQQKAAFEDIAKDLGIKNIPVWVKAKMSEPTAKESRMQLGTKILGKYAPYQKLGRPPLNRNLAKQGDPTVPKGSAPKTGSVSQPPRVPDSSDSDDSEGIAPGQPRELKSGDVDPAMCKAAAAGEESSEDEDEDIDSDSDSDPDDQLPSILRADVHNTVKQHYNPRASAQTDVSGGEHGSYIPIMEIDNSNDAINVELNEVQSMDDLDPNSPANVAARVFARIGKPLPKPAPATMPTSQFALRPDGTYAVGTPPRPASQPVYQPPRPQPSNSKSTLNVTPQPAAATSNPHGRGRPRKKSFSSRKSVAAPAYEAPLTPVPNATSPAVPIAQMVPSPSTPISIDPAPPTPVPNSIAPSSSDSVVQPARPAINSTPSPALVLRPEEMDANKSTLSAVDQYNDAAQIFKELLQARTENRAVPGSLTGLPPSTKDVETARQKLKDATNYMLSAL